jgi:hypothetical protein
VNAESFFNPHKKKAALAAPLSLTGIAASSLFVLR